MKFLRDLLDKQKPLFQKGGKLENLYYLYEAGETFMFSPNHTAATKGAQVKDAIDLKRMMITVVIAMIPCLLFGIYNTGHMHYLAVGEAATFGDKFVLGLTLVLPIVLVAYTAGGIVEAVFAVVRKHPINEGFLVTGMLIPLVVPATTPLWQVALATVFAVVIAKEVFGGTGMNILNVAMTARAFLYFAYPAQISGDQVWTYLGDKMPVDGFSGATALAVAYQSGQEGVNAVANLASHNSVLMDNMFSFQNLFMGFIPGSIGETSTLMVLIGAAILIFTGVGSWKIIFSGFAGAYLMAVVMQALAVNEFMAMPAHYHLVMGGVAFGIVFMATDPVSAAQTESGKWIYGLLIGVLTIIIRVTNPAYPEGIMLAVLFMNVFAPLIDYYVVKANKKRRLQRATV
ncbi:NADH:ubiquinone reductase (Na(+)-transporting) subunit B [Cyclobacterium marinum]|uniref:Na(+)-translocating NADH-quinone reductase subunit B n=1 Tax=Cyclobacterium marinum (strain ATCC 25205 / DSM 745 / LMG 13164 / NCIMB 1802) TaxID=880070 RepID=G0IZS9_CYCMS|nr:NADH:ubiquinone reductase (Na(+)-transporting) subunit B [Cyclobacterium marinum]AEL25743.1 NADH:ubiquinone oxidoreductase, subunit B [Cyclobacterium marinum DSM 745]MBI0401175.1 NADH:ubiquinone reductase (Na(+)-transporting) subunit B [Cyclobacterium marinum]MBR9773923.1 NADH:ubiquinone reductase (Na(+)-transporting) subunit B [Cytophagales bacterium]|tara:strand:+ start:61251 stop:62453 length:1203 start_codon:yes stop_codon:yes gene_type:complete